MKLFLTGIALLLAGFAGPMPVKDDPAPASVVKKLAVESDHDGVESHADNTLKEIFAGAAKFTEAAKQAEVPPAPVPVQVAPDPKPNTPPPAVTPSAPTPVAPPQPAPDAGEPSNPNIVLDCPPNGSVGTVIVVTASRSSNIRKLKWIITPPVAFYPDPKSNPNPREIVFAVPSEGVYKVTVKASSPDGGMDERTEQAQVGTPETGNPPAAMMRSAPTSYAETVRLLLGDVRAANKRELCGALALAYHDVAEDIAYDRIRTEEEFYRKLDSEITRRLGNQEPLFDTFNTKIGVRFKAENGNLPGLKTGCEETDLRLRQYDKFGR